jgi:hypothetical protein
MRHHTGCLAASLLTQDLKNRFDSLFAVAERKSVFSWTEVAPSKADVILMDRHTRVLSVQAPPCLVFVGNAPDAARCNFDWGLSIDADFTVSQLVDLLDRAAVRLLDLRARQASASGAAASGQEPERYALKRWASLALEFRSTGQLRAMALLSRGAISFDQLCRHSGLRDIQVEALLAELTRMDVLRIAAPSRSVPEVRRTATLLSRLSDWLSGHRPSIEKAA